MSYGRNGYPLVNRTDTHKSVVSQYAVDQFPVSGPPSPLTPTETTYAQVRPSLSPVCASPGQTRSHSSHYFSQARHPSISTKSSTVATTSIFSYYAQSNTPPTSPSEFTWDHGETDDDSNQPPEYEISIGSTRYSEASEHGASFIAEEDEEPVPPEQEFDMQWIAGLSSKGITEFDVDDVVLRPQPVPVTMASLTTGPQGDSFESAARLWARRSTASSLGISNRWTFQSQIQANPDRGRKGQVWAIPGIDGAFLVRKGHGNGSTTSNQLVAQYLFPKVSAGRRTHSGRENDSSSSTFVNTTPSKPPLLVVHQHSKVRAFSLGWFLKDGVLDDRQEGPSSHPEIRKPRSMYLLATQTVQTSFTSTSTVKRLDDHGLLDNNKKAAEAPSSSTTSPKASRGKLKDVPGSTVSAPSVLVSPAGAAGGSSRPFLPRLNLTVPTRHPLMEDENDESAIRLLRRRKSHYEAFGVLTVEEIQQYRDIGDASPSMSQNDKAQERQRMNETMMDNLIGAPTGKYYRKSSLQSAPAHLPSPPTYPPSTISESETPTGSRARSPSTLGLTFAPYRPPWVTFPSSSLIRPPPPTEAEQEQKRVLHTLNRNFQKVGLLDNPDPKPHRKLQETPSETEVFSGIPSSALLMLLPLWTGPLDAVHPTDRRFLVIWYRIWDTDPDKSRIAPNHGPAEEPHKPFHILARLVSHSELQDTGIRMPVNGIQTVTSLTMSDVPEEYSVVEVRDAQSLARTDYVLAQCYPEASGAVEFDEECLLRLGLAEKGRRRRNREASRDDDKVYLSAIGRSVLEMSWIGALAHVQLAGAAA
ncbi:hypothetical protein C8J56DRAFT_1133828 [Mycena floridula]|nr:hypothetical protein C8J56DRAFT_1133828 [Mycena floridula]